MRAPVSVVVGMVLAAPAAWGQTFIDHAVLDPVSEPSPNGFGAGVAFYDYDGDGWEDLAVAHQIHGVFLYRNSGEPDFDFTEVTDDVALPPVMVGAVGSAGTDVDRDGDQDLLVLDDRALRLFRWVGDEYEEASRRALPGTPWLTSTVTFADVDADGWTDLFVTGYTLAVDFPFHDCAPDMLLHNNGDGTFEDIAVQTGTDDRGCGLTALFSDYDRDGDPDLFVGNDYGMFIRSTRLYRNDGLGPDGMPTFTDVSETAGANRRLYNMGLTTADVNEDGWPDYFGTSIGRDVLMLGSADGVFSDATERYGVGAEMGYENWRVTWGCRFLDVEQDGFWDLHVASGFLAAANEIRSFPRQPSLMFMHLDGETPSPDMAAELDIAPFDQGRSVAVTDFDDDGDDDVAKGAIGGGVHIYRNEVGAGPALRVFLRGTVSTPEAYGAWLRLDCDGVRREREVVVGGALASSSSPTMRMPMAGCEEGGVLTVTWPSGLQEAMDVSGDGQRIVLVEPSWITFSPATAPADGLTPLTIEVTPRGLDGLLLGEAHEVTITAASGTMSAVSDLGDGRYQADLRADTAGNIPISVAIDGVAMPAHPRARFFPDGRDATSVYASPPWVLPNESNLEVTVVPRDAAGTPDGEGHLVTFDVVGAAQLGDTVDNGDGSYSGTFRGGAGGSFRVDARVDGLPRGPSAEPDILARIDPDRTSVRMEPGWITAGEEDIDIAIQVAIRDGLGNVRFDAPNLPYELVGAGGPVAIGRVGNRAGGASLHALASDLLAGCPCTLTVDDVTLPRTIELSEWNDDAELLAALDPTKSRIGPFIESAHADGQDYAWIDVELRDGDGDGLPMTDRFGWSSDRMTLIEQRTLSAGLVGKAWLRAGLVVGPAAVDVTFDGLPTGVGTFVDLVPPIAHDLDADRVTTCLHEPVVAATGGGAVRIDVRALEEHDFLLGSGYPLALYLDGEEHELPYEEPGTYVTTIPVPDRAALVVVQTEILGTGRGSTGVLEFYTPGEDPINANRPACADADVGFVRYGAELPDGGVDAGLDAGVADEDGGATDDGGTADASVGTDGGALDAGDLPGADAGLDAGPIGGGAAGGCGCRVEGGARGTAAGWFSALFLALLVRRRVTRSG